MKELMKELTLALRLFDRICNDEYRFDSNAGSYEAGWIPGENVDADAQAAEIINLAKLAIPGYYIGGLDDHEAELREAGLI